MSRVLLRATQRRDLYDLPHYPPAKNKIEKPWGLFKNMMCGTNTTQSGSQKHRNVPGQSTGATHSEDPIQGHRRCSKGVVEGRPTTVCSPHYGDEREGEGPSNLEERGVDDAQAGVIGEDGQGEEHRSQSLFSARFKRTHERAADKPQLGMKKKETLAGAGTLPSPTHPPTR